MKHSIVSAFIAVSLGLVSPAQSGTPAERRVKCPIGGARVEVRSTRSCTVWGSVTMSLRRPSSCDFVTRLPVCKKQDFPIYRDFSADERKQLKKLVEEPWYQTARSQSRYLRAYLIEKELNGMPAKDVFWLLQDGHFYDPANTYGNKAYYDAFRNAANTYLPLARDEDKKLILLMAAFARIHLNEPAKAKTMLAAAAQYDTPKVPFFDQYLNAVKACLNTPDAPDCRPEFEIKQ